MKSKIIITLLVVAVLATLLWAGNLNPSAPPTAGTMKPLDQVEPRTAIPGSSTPVSTYTISQPGSYYLTGDRLCGADGIAINADHVTVDLNGFSLIGPGISESDPSTFGINLSSGRKNVEIRNGTIRNFRFAGINDFYGLTNGGRGYRILRIRSMYNGGDGMRVDGKGHLVQDCTAIGNGGHGINMASVMASRATGNVVTQNQKSGIWIFYTDNLVDHNLAYENNLIGASWKNITNVAGNTYVNNHAP